MKLRHLLLLAIGTILLAACNMTLAADVTPPPGYVPPTPVPTLGPLYPNSAPNIENGKVIFADKCAPCHGDTGLGNGPQSKDLPVSVIPIGLPEFAREADPAKWYATVTQGNLERFMPPFNSLTDQERWDVISYALTLHTTADQVELGKTLFEENCKDCSKTFSNLETMSALSEDELVAMIREGSGDVPAFGSGFNEDEAYAVAAYLRTLTFAPPAAPVAVATTETSVNAEGTPLAEGTPQANTTPETQTADSTISGKIDNRAGVNIPADTMVTLRGFVHGADPSAGPQEFVNLQAPLNADGTYEFQVEPLVENQIYLSEVAINGFNYQTEYAIVPAGTTDMVLSDIIVYPTSDDYNVLRVQELQIFFDLASDQAQMFAVYSFVNDTENTIVIDMGTDQSVPFINFPEGFTSLGYEAAQDSAAFVPTDNGFAIPPSATPYGLIAFASVPNEKEIKVTQKALLPVHAVTLFLPEGVTAEGSTLTDLGVQNLQGTNFQMYSASGINTGDSFEYTLKGAPVGTTDSTTDFTQNQTVLIGAGGLGLALIIAGVWMYLRDKNKQTEESDEEDKEYDDTESVMDAIIALDDLHRTGKISDEAYKKRRDELKDALKRKG
ncbi:MAG TPA: c-type cytochrome [Anaerolineales bacterium]|nr:c-type cytochrome [Anaerolineales bacterium]